MFAQILMLTHCFWGCNELMWFTTKFHSFASLLSSQELNGILSTVKILGTPLLLKFVLVLFMTSTASTELFYFNSAKLNHFKKCLIYNY